MSNELILKEAELLKEELLKNKSKISMPPFIDIGEYFAEALGYSKEDLEGFEHLGNGWHRIYI